MDVASSTAGFIDSLSLQFEKLLKHDFVAKEQNRFYVNLKNDLKPGEVLVTLDFAENYSFVVQEAAQAFHWNNDQATLCPMVIYYRENDECKHCSFVVISDCRHHDTYTVHVFQTELVRFLKDKFVNVKKMFYFSDGAPQHFKNKSAFVNLFHHYDDFNIAAEWHYFATSHGKGPCDGLGGAVKRLASRASLQMGTREQILTPMKLYDWAHKTLQNINFVFVSKDRYTEKKAFLDNRFTNCIAVKGTQSLHTVILIVVPQTAEISKREDFGYLDVKLVSSSCNSKKVKICRRS